MEALVCPEVKGPSQFLNKGKWISIGAGDKREAGVQLAPGKGKLFMTGA